MGLKTRDCPCERWTSVKVETEHSSVRFKKIPKESYILFVFDDKKPTSWAKFSPVQSTKEHKPGAVALEFWTATTPTIATCGISSHLLANSKLCNDKKWNNFLMQGVIFRKSGSIPD